MTIVAVGSGVWFATSDLQKPMFSISDKVVCVDDSFGGWQRRAWNTLPKRGAVYVIRGFSLCAFDPDPGLLLVGISTHEITAMGCEKGFWHTRFRKLTDIQAENALRNSEPSLTNGGDLPCVRASTPVGAPPITP